MKLKELVELFCFGHKFFKIAGLVPELRDQAFFLFKSAKTLIDYGRRTLLLKFYDKGTASQISL